MGDPEIPKGRVAQVMAACALLIALGACVVAIVALNKKPAVAKVNLAVATSEIQARKSEVAMLHALVAKSDATMAKVTTCLPEVTSQLDGMTVETSSSAGWLTSAYLHEGKQLSTYCTSTLEAPPAG